MTRTGEVTHLMHLTILTVPICLMSVAADAETVAWKGEVQLGVISTTGNSETEVVKAGASLVNERLRWRHSGAVDFVRSVNQDTTTARRFSLLAKSDYKITQLSYAFGVLTYEDDRFSGYDYQASVAAGYGRKLIAREGLLLEVELGPGARRNEPESGDTQDEAILRGALNLDWKIGATAGLAELFSVEAGEEITRTKSVTALRSHIAGNLAAKITYTVRHASAAPVGTDETDTEFSVTLVYAF